MTKKHSIMKLVTVLLLMAVAVSCMTGCGSVYTAEGYKPPAGHSEESDDPDPAAAVEQTEVPVEETETEIPVDETQQLDVSDGETDEK